MTVVVDAQFIPRVDEDSRADLLDHCRARLARYKVPKIVVFASELPLSAAGKILKRELR